MTNEFVLFVADTVGGEYTEVHRTQDNKDPKLQALIDQAVSEGRRYHVDASSKTPMMTLQEAKMQNHVSRLRDKFCR